MPPKAEAKAKAKAKCKARAKAKAKAKATCSAGVKRPASNIVPDCSAVPAADPQCNAVPAADSGRNEVAEEAGSEHEDVAESDNALGPLDPNAGRKFRRHLATAPAHAQEMVKAVQEAGRGSQKTWRELADAWQKGGWDSALFQSKERSHAPQKPRAAALQ